MKVLAIPLTHALCHVCRLLLVAQELKKRGHEIVFAGDTKNSKYTKLIENEGFELCWTYEPEAEKLFNNFLKRKIKFLSSDETAKMVESDLALYKTTGPDILLTDARFTAIISSSIANIKHIAITNVLNTEYRAFAWLPVFDWLPKSKIRKTLETALVKLEMFVYDNTFNAPKNLSGQYSLEKRVTAGNCMTGKDITLLADLPQCYTTRNLPNNYHFIGPLMGKSNIQPPSWWPLKKNGQPILYMTMGSTGTPDFFHKIYEQLKRADITTVITTGGRTINIAPIKDRLYLEPLINEDLIMEACDLVICHGGNSTIYQALKHGKPIIGIPTLPAQEVNLRQIKNLGLAKTLSWQKFSRNPNLLFKMIRSALQDKQSHQNTQNFKKFFTHYSPAQTAVDIIEKAV